MDKPLVIRLNEAKADIVSAINKAIQQDGLPCYLLEPIVSELLTQLRDGARNELQMAREQMNNIEQNKE